MADNENLNCLRYYFNAWVCVTKQENLYILCFGNIGEEHDHICKRCIVNINLPNIDGKFTITVCNDRIGDCWKFQDILDDLHINKSLHAKPWFYTKINRFNIIDSNGNIYDRNSYLKDSNLPEYRNYKFVQLYLYPSKSITETCKCRECKQKIQIMNLKITSLKRRAIKRKDEFKKKVKEDAEETKEVREINDLAQKKRERNKRKKLRKKEKEQKEKRELLKRKEIEEEERSKKEKVQNAKKIEIVPIIRKYISKNIQKYIDNDIYNSNELYTIDFINKVDMHITLLYIDNIQEDHLLIDDNIKCVATIIHNSSINFLIEMEKLITKEYSNYLDRLIQEEKKLVMIT